MQEVKTLEDFKSVVHPHRFYSRTGNYLRYR